MASQALAAPPAPSPARALPPPRAARAWAMALRARTLGAAVGPVLVGLALAWALGAFRPIVAGLTLASALLLQVGVNLANDYYDHVKGVDRADRAGPPRATGLLARPGRMRQAMLACLAGAAIPGLWLVVEGGLPILAIGLAGMACAVLYAGGPRPFGHHGLGEVVVFAFFGPVAVAGTVYLQAGAFPAEAWLAGVAPGALAAAILLVNNVRDIPTDARAGKRTLAVRLGARRSWGAYAFLLALAFAAPAALALGTGLGPGPLLALLALPPALAVARACARSPGGAALNPLLVRTAQVHLLACLLLAGGLLLPRGLLP